MLPKDSILSSVTHYFLQFNSVLIIIDLVLVLVLGLEGLVLVLVLGCLVLVLVLVLVVLVLVLVLVLEGQVLVNITGFVYSPVRIVNLNVKPRIRPIGQKKKLIRLPCYREDECQIFLNPPIFY